MKIKCIRLKQKYVYYIKQDTRKWMELQEIRKRLEETEVKKDVEWLKKEIEEVLYSAHLRGEHTAMHSNVMYDDIVNKIDQLDEPKVLSEEMKQSDLILYLDELETMTEQLIEGLQVKLVRDSLDRCSESYLDGKLIEKKRLLLTEEEYIGFLKGNIIKYDDRMNHKGDLENDLRKSKWYVERLRSSYYGGTNPLD